MPKLEYVAYADPGSQTKLMFSDSVNKQKLEAIFSKHEAYQEIIAGLRLPKTL